MKNHISKLLSNTITEKELEELNNWLKEPENQFQLEAYILDLHDLNLTTQKNNVDEAFKNVISKIENTKKQTINLPLYKRPLFKYAVAASLVLLISLTFLVKKNNTKKYTLANTNIETGTDKATLTLEDGTEVVLEKGADYKSHNVISNGEEIVYEVGESAKTEISYNYLTISRGGQFFIKLSDGTKVWLNSDSKLRYPVNFVKGESRKVELIYGEAYFDVSPSAEHNGSNFIVANKGYNIEVLGTEFNIKSYLDDPSIYTTLVEGKVKIDYQNKVYALYPNQLAVLNKQANTMVIDEVDVYDQVSWKDGIFSFNRMTLKDIMAVLSRWYDIDVVFQNKSIENRGFNGLLSKDQEIIEILETLKEFEAINDYKIYNKTVKLK